jgi:hypothetical protein
VKKRHSAEQIVAKLRQADVELAFGTSDVHVAPAPGTLTNGLIVSL